MRSRFIALAALAAFVFGSAPAFAAPVYNGAQQGTAGVIVTGTDPSGNTVKFILQNVALTDATGVAIGTAGNPLVTTGATGSSSVVTQPTASNLNATVSGAAADGAAAIGNPVFHGCEYNTSAGSLTTGNVGYCRLSANHQTTVVPCSATDNNYVNCAAIGAASDNTGGNVAMFVNSYSRLQSASNTYSQKDAAWHAANGGGIGVASVEEDGRLYSNITTNTTTTVKSGKGDLHAICVNTKGASANTATIYDNTAGSGTKIATLDTTSGVSCIHYDVAFGTGLTIVTATGTAPDLTISYR